MEPTTEVVSSLDYELARGPRDFDDTGHYRWPFGLELRNAWRFLEPRTPLTAVSSRRFTMDSALGIVPLLPEERILALPREPVGLLRPIRAAARVEGSDAARRKAAPPPTTLRAGVMHMRRAPAFTYAMALHGTAQPAFKIGWAFDWKLRERQFNQASLPQLGGVSYKTILQELWGTAIDAFRMEQSLLRTFDRRRCGSNVEVVLPVTEAELQTAWVRYLMDHRRGAVSAQLHTGRTSTV